MSPESLPCKNGHQPIRGELPATQTSAGAESQLFQVPEQRGGTWGPTRVQGEVTGETLKGQKTHPGCGGAGGRQHQGPGRSCWGPGPIRLALTQPPCPQGPANPRGRNQSPALGQAAADASALPAS